MEVGPFCQAEVGAQKIDSSKKLGKWRFLGIRLWKNG